jgi:hypothetical protein
MLASSDGVQTGVNTRGNKELAAGILGTKTDMIPRRGLHPLLRKNIEASAVQVF